jgi:hypothetical protein
VARLLGSLREAGADEQAAALASRLPMAGMFGLYLEQEASADQFRFGREADGTPAARWGWEDLDLWVRAIHKDPSARMHRAANDEPGLFEQRVVVVRLDDDDRPRAARSLGQLLKQGDGQRGESGEDGPSYASLDCSRGVGAETVDLPELQRERRRACGGGAGLTGSAPWRTNTTQLDPTLHQ